MRLRKAFYPFLAISFTSCNLVTGNCRYELRSLDAAGSVNENGAELASAQIVLSEERGSINSTSFQWLLTGTTLKGHVLSAAFKDASDPSVVRLDLPLASAERPEISQAAVDTRMGANLGGVRDLLAADRGLIELQTDMTSRPTVTLPLIAHRIGDWIRPNCS